MVDIFSFFHFVFFFILFSTAEFWWSFKRVKKKMEINEEQRKNDGNLKFLLKPISILLHFENKQKTKAWTWKSLLNLTFSSKKELYSQKAIRGCTGKFTFCLRLTTCKAKKGLLWTHVQFADQSLLMCSGRIRNEILRRFVKLWNLWKIV